MDAVFATWLTNKTKTEIKIVSSKDIDDVVERIHIFDAAFSILSENCKTEFIAI